MSLSSLPTELLQHIASDIESLETLRALSCANSRFYAIFNPVLYRQDADKNKALGSIAVTWAAQHGELEILRKALDHGAVIPPCAPEQYKSSGFFQRRERVPAHWGMHVRDERTDHPLCTAVKYGHANITEFLIVNQKCNIIMWDREGHLLLSVAVIHGHTHIIKLLLELGSPQSDKKNWMFECPLQIAVVQGDEAVIKALLSPPNMQCCWSNLPQIQQALNHALFSDEDNKERIIDLLLDSVPIQELGALNFRFEHPQDAEFISPLSWAVEHEDIKYLKRFLSKGADPNYDWTASQSYILKAVKLQRADMVSLLIPGTEQARCIMALAWSVKLWSPSLPFDDEKRDIPRILLENGALPDYEPLDEEIIIGRSKEAYGGESFPPNLLALVTPPLIMAVDYGHFELVRLLLEYGANMNVRYHGTLDHGRGWTMRTPLSLATQLGHQDIVDFLKGRGAEVPAQSELDWLKSIKMSR